MTVQVYGDLHPVGPVYPDPPHCPNCATVPGVWVGAELVVVADLVVVEAGGETAAPYMGGPGIHTS